MTLDVDGVGVELGGKRVLEEIDATVEEGSFVGVVGPNGAGKTTLLRTINAALSPDAGAVFLDGADVHDLQSRTASRLMASVPQHTDLSFDFTVREVVEMGRHPHRRRFGRTDDPDGRRRVDRALARASIDHLADRPITDVSGGERQRVLLARALAQDAPVLLLDEPNASLDVNHQVRTLDLLADLVADGRTAVAAIHDLDLAARYCEELVLVADGRVLASGEPTAVLTPENIRAAFGVGAAVSSNPVTGTPSVTALPERGTAAGAVHVLGGRGAAPLLAPLVAAGFDVSVGPVPVDSRDHAVADGLGLDVVAVPPFDGVSEAARESARDRVDRAGVTVVSTSATDLGANPSLRAAADVCVVAGDDTGTVEWNEAHGGTHTVQVAKSEIVAGVSAALDGDLLERSDPPSSVR